MAESLRNGHEFGALAVVFELFAYFLPTGDKVRFAGCVEDRYSGPIILFIIWLNERVKQDSGADIRTHFICGLFISGISDGGPSAHREPNDASFLGCICRVQVLEGPLNSFLLILVLVILPSLIASLRDNDIATPSNHRGHFVPHHFYIVTALAPAMSKRDNGPFAITYRLPNEHGLVAGYDEIGNLLG